MQTNTRFTFTVQLYCWRTLVSQTARVGGGTHDNDNNRGATERRTNEIGPFCHQAKNVDLRKPPRPRRRAAAATRVALARCTAARPFSL